MLIKGFSKRDYSLSLRLRRSNVVTPNHLAAQIPTWMYILLCWVPTCRSCRSLGFLWLSFEFWDLSVEDPLTIYLQMHITTWPVCVYRLLPLAMRSKLLSLLGSIQVCHRVGELIQAMALLDCADGNESSRSLYICV